MSEQVKNGLINLDEFLSEKFGGKKFSPLLIKILEKVLHIKEMNSVIEEIGPDTEGIEFCNRAMKTFNYDLEIIGLENIPNDGTLYTFASNHPLGGGDGIILSSLVGSRFGSLQLLVNDFLMAIKPLRPMSVPINKMGAQVRNLPTLIRDAYNTDRQVLIFPAGVCSRKIDGKIQDLSWNKSFIKMSRETGRTVVPVHFEGVNSKRFYRVANVCKKLKIKFNFAMLLLPDEFAKTRNKHFKIVFGKPIRPEFFDKSKTDLEWAAWVREQVYNL